MRFHLLTALTNPALLLSTSQVPELGFRFDTEVMTSGEVLTPLVEIDIVGGLISPCSAKLTKARSAQWNTAQPRYIDTSAPDPKVEGNGLNPRWDKPLDVSCVVWHPAHAFIRFSVYRRSRLPGYQRPLRQLLAYEMIPIVSLRQGYRSVPLRSTSGQPIRCVGVVWAAFPWIAALISSVHEVLRPVLRCGCGIGRCIPPARPCFAHAPPLPAPQ